MTPDDLAELDRERREADVRYNDALTALDRAIVAGGGNPAGVNGNTTTTALLVFLQQITAFVESKDRQLAAEARRRVETIAQSLEPMAELRTQTAVLQRAMEAVRRTVASLQSSVVSRQSSVVSQQSSVVSQQSPVVSQQSPVVNQQSSVVSQQSPVVSQQSPVVSQQSPVVGQQSPVGGGHEPFVLRPADHYKYVGFEDQFRGSDEVIQERLRAYVPIFEGRSDVLDIGCGRGELLSAFKAGGIRARGIDTNGEMAAIARERGLDVTQADALAYVASLPDGSLGGVIATQVVEHLEPSYLMRLLDTIARVLQPGAPLVLETINAACWLAFFSSYIRDFTHVRPVHPETLQYLLLASGFERVEIRYSAPVPEHVKMKTIDLPAAVRASPDAVSNALAQIAHTVNANAVILNNLMFTHMDYAAIGFRS